MANDNCGMNTDFKQRPTCEEKTATWNNSETGGCKPEGVNEGDLVFIKREGKNFIFSKYANEYEPFANTFVEDNKIYYIDENCEVKNLVVNDNPDPVDPYVPPTPFNKIDSRLYTKDSHAYGHDNIENIGDVITLPRTGVYNLHMTASLYALCTCASNPQEGKRRMGATLGFIRNGGDVRLLGYVGDATDITPVNNGGQTSSGTDILKPAGFGGIVAKFTAGDKVQFVLKETVLRSEAPVKVDVFSKVSIGIN